MGYVLNKDWDKFEAAFRVELQKLNASANEIETLLDAAYAVTTCVDDITRYAEDELQLLREQEES